MKTVSVSDVKAGSRLAKPVLDGNGRVLLRKDALLSEGVLQRLERWNIPSVCIVDGIRDNDDSTPTEHVVVDGADWSEVLDQSYERFAGNEEMELIQNAFRQWHAGLEDNPQGKLTKAEDS